ncbi:hypothetical protein KGF56_004599 [Candida oxycetoniae]|uniref:Phosphatidate phosphatase APP1 catalytic domain-containing protein n=1 Tax=Candida oxycetoniae TaxID=497107 RepID=A0AAI9SSX4_9ASCO|nr:uncharacterized protein KGF56_004599 [Candida oxycetoniae]KAI3402507.2 hypothetical protein KGF56_004599 [Candida oxycetoniae]
MSRRQRLIGLAKTTRDNYIPKITTSVSSVAAGASKAFTNPGEIYDKNGRVLLPEDATIQLYPTYTRYRHNKYHVDVAGWVSAPGSLTNRRNRMLLTVIRKTMRQRDGQTANQEIEKLEHDANLNQEIFNPNSQSSSSSSDTESITSSGSEPSTNSLEISATSDDTMKQRIAAFFAKSIPNTELKILIGSENASQKLNDATVYTDDTGYFAATIAVDYKPSIISATSTITETVFAFQSILLYPNTGIGIISDIDDTVKMTGITGDKRLMLRNLLVEDFESWSIPPIIKWYAELYKKEQVDFFYVSNSPWQLFNSIQSYLRISGLPAGTIHLKKWVGNIISSLLEPSQSRKKRTLSKILDDFPEKKFICIGDSGEQDLEAYVDLARAYRNQVISINIRYVENTFSDDDDQRIYKEVLRLIARKRKQKFMSSSSSSSSSTTATTATTATTTNTTNTTTTANTANTTNTTTIREGTKKKFAQSNFPPKPSRAAQSHVEDLIDLETPVLPPRKVSPMVPKKPASLKGEPLDKTVQSQPLSSGISLHGKVVAANDSTADTSKPPSSNIASDGHWMVGENLPPLPPRRSRSPKIKQGDQDLYDELDDICSSPGFLDLEETDKKGANWIRRIIMAIHALRDTDTTINIFMDHDEEFFKNSCSHVDEILRVK